MINQPLFTTFKPKNPKLQEVIAYYYFHTCQEDNSVVEFDFFPNYLHAITIYKGSNVVVENDCSTVTPNSGDDFCKPLYTVNLDRIFRVKMFGKFSKFGIVFQPLGLNHFLEKNLSDVVKDRMAPFNYFGEPFIEAINLIFCDCNNPNKMDVLEDFLLSKIVPKHNLSQIKSAISILINAESNIKVDDMALELNINRKSLLRIFKKHTLASVEEYKKMVMFRRALNFSKLRSDNPSLTEIALYNLYYDQAHFIKHFKAITNETPSALLNKIEKVGSENTFWSFS